MKEKNKLDNGQVSRWRTHGRRGVLAGLLAMTALTEGCYGRFPMTHALYHMNGNVHNKVVRNVVFWLLAWFPIYWFAQIGDAIIFNLIDFWGGAEVDINVSSVQGDGTVTLLSSEDHSTLYMTVSKKGEPDTKLRFVSVGGGKYEMRDDANHLTGKIIRTARGDLNLTDATGNTLRTITAADIAAEVPAR